VKAKFDTIKKEFQTTTPTIAYERINSVTQKQREQIKMLLSPPMQDKSTSKAKSTSPLKSRSRSLTPEKFTTVKMHKDDKNNASPLSKSKTKSKTKEEHSNVKEKIKNNSP